MKRQLLLYYISLIFSMAILPACDEDPDQGKPLVGFSQCAMDTDWRKAMDKKYQAKALQRNNFVLKVTDGCQSNNNQIQDIRDSLIPMGIKVLMVSPNQSAPLTQVVCDVYNSGIPVIVIDRTIEDSSHYTCYIGANNYQIGCLAGDYAGTHGKDGSTVFEIFGELGSSPTRDRSNGFNTRLRETYAQKKFKYVGSFHGKWNKELTQSLMCDYLNNNPPPDIIYAHNDDMAIGASLAISEFGYDTDNIIIIGTDGTVNGGIKAVKEGIIDATFSYPDGADEAIDIAERILRGESVPKEIILNTYQIDKSNADGQYELMKSQDKVNEGFIQLSKANKTQFMQLNGQNRTIILGSILCFVMFLLLIYVAKLHMDNKKANQMLNEKNAEVNAQKEELEAQALHLNEINKQLETSREMILGSIRYAQTIQTAALPTENDLNCDFKSFVLYHPKDIVSGDFYWNYCEKLDDREVHIIGVIDCTGHGVPGAFMSLIGVNLLDQIVKQKKIFSPASILLELNKAVRSALRQQENHNNDGMEAIICKIEDFGNNNYSMTYEGAKFPIYHYIKSGNHIATYKSSRRQIGGQFRNIESMLNFEDHVVQVSPGDRIYMTSDGLSDQNNQARKRYTATRLVEKLMESIQMDMPQQRDYIWEDVSSFMTGCGQRDDITVLGIEL